MAENENIVLTEAVYYILISLIKPNHGYGIRKAFEYNLKNDYFRQLDNEDSFEIFSDIDSKLNHLIKIRFLFIFVLNLNILIAIINSTRDETKYFILITIVCIIISIIVSLIVGRKINKLKRKE